MSDGVIATDRRGRIVIINAAALDILNLRSERIVGTPLLDVLRLDRTVTFRDLLESQEERMITFEEDGEDTIVQCEFSVIQRESGFISGLVCVLTDVTETLNGVSGTLHVFAQFFQSLDGGEVYAVTSGFGTRQGATKLNRFAGEHARC